MEIEYTLRPDDLQAFTRYHSKLPGMQTPFTWSAAPGVVVMLLAVGLSLHFAASFSQEPVVIIGVLIGLGGAALGGVWLQICRVRSFYKAECDDPRNAWVLRDVRFIISSDQLLTIARGGTMSYHWSVVWRIGLTQKHIFLCIGRTTAIIIPRRAFRDPAHCEEFVALVCRYQRDCVEQKPKPTGIITSLPPEPTAIRRSDMP